MATTNLKTYALQSEEQIRKRYQDLLMQKYGAGNFDTNKSYYEQAGQKLSSWTDLDEKRAGYDYERYINDAQQNQLLQQTGQQVQQANVSDKATQNLNNELIQKYLGNTLRASGMANSGVANLQQQGIANAYQKNINAIDTNTQNELDYYLNAYKAKEQEGELNYQNKVAPIYEQAQTSFVEGLESKLNDNTLTIEDYQKAREVYAMNSNVSPQELQALDQYYIGNINKAQEEKLLNDYDITNKTFTFAIDNKRFNLPSIRKNDIAHNETRLNAIKANPQMYENVVVKLYDTTGRKTYLIRNGRLFEIKNKHEEDRRFSGKINPELTPNNNQL